MPPDDTPVSPKRQPLQRDARRFTSQNEGVFATLPNVVRPVNEIVRNIATLTVSKQADHPLGSHLKARFTQSL